MSVAWSPLLLGQKIVSSSNDNSIKIWDIETSLCLSTLSGHTNWVLSVAWSPFEQKIVSGSHDHEIKIWNAETYECLGVLNGHTDYVTSVAWSPSLLLLGQKIASASGSYDNGIKIWDISNYEDYKKFQFID